MQVRTMNVSTMRGLTVAALGLLLGVVMAPLAASAQDANCGGDFNQWMQGLRKEAPTRGIGPAGVAGLDGLTPDPAVLSRDRNQQVFRQTFEEFAPKRVAPLLKPAANKLRTMAAFFDGLETRTGVASPVVIAIWGLETSFGAVQGDFSTLRALVTLAHDCRRAERFRAELFDALKIVDSGAMTPAGMKGAWAGEIGQTQFMPSSYLKYAAGQDLIHNSQAALNATANFLKGSGWKKLPAGNPDSPISTSSRNGTNPTSMRAPSPISPPGSTRW